MSKNELQISISKDELWISENRLYIANGPHFLFFFYYCVKMLSILLEGAFMCGPCPLYAIKHGLVNKPFDCPFIFSEVNADEIHWKPAPCGGFVKFKVKNNK